VGSMCAMGKAMPDSDLDTDGDMWISGCSGASRRVEARVQMRGVQRPDCQAVGIWGTILSWG
jgi:hypothetical protein